MNPLNCNWDAARLLIFSDNVFSNLIYYSHLGTMVISLVFGAFVFYINPKGVLNRLLLGITITFSAWSYIDLILWATEKNELTMFFWSILIYFDLLLYVLSFYLIYFFIYKKLPSWSYNLLIFLLFVPLFALTHTRYNLLGFDLSNCDREAIEGPLWFYTYLVELVMAIWITILGWRATNAATDKQRQNQLLFMIGSLLLFLFFFSIGNIAGTLAIDWDIGQYGMFGMPIFLALLTYAIVEFKILNTKLIAANALVVVLCLLLLSLIFVNDFNLIRILILITFIISVILGYFLIRSVKKEVETREYIQKLAGELSVSRDEILIANEKLKELDKQKTEFVSIASHQLRAPLTAIKGYSSMLLEGSFGKLGKKSTEAVERIEESSERLINVIEDFLNITRIELGKMKYEMANFDLKKLLTDLTTEVKPSFDKKKLKLEVQLDSGDFNFFGDTGKIRQVFSNLIDNAIKYTPKGEVKISLTKSGQTIKFTIQDTGVGFSASTKANMFEKFIRADNAGKTNISGTGLGLYVAKQIVEAHKGKIDAQSAGPGKGSTFTVELPTSLTK